MPTGLKINATDGSTAAFVLLCAPYDRTASFRKGACEGPSAIVSSLKYQMETYDRFTDSMPAPHRRYSRRPEDPDHGVSSFYAGRKQPKAQVQYATPILTVLRATRRCSVSKIRTTAR